MTSTLIQTYAAHGYEVLDLAVAEQNDRFVSVGGDKSVFLWDVATAQTVRRWGGAGGHSGRVECCAFGGEGDAVVLTGELLLESWGGEEEDGEEVVERRRRGNTRRRYTEEAEGKSNGEGRGCWEIGRSRQQIVDCKKEKAWWNEEAEERDRAETTRKALTTSTRQFRFNSQNLGYQAALRTTHHDFHRGQG